MADTIVTISQTSIPPSTITYGGSNPAGEVEGIGATQVNPSQDSSEENNLQEQIDIIDARLDASPVADWAALLAVDGTSLPDGQDIYVQTFRTNFVLNKSSAATAETYVVGAAIGGGRWIRNNNDTSLSWTLVETWYVDAVDGDDENDGESEEEAIASFEEFTRRVKANESSWGGFVTVNIVSDYTGDFLLDFDLSQVDITFLIQGTAGRTVAATGTITVVVPPNPATPQEYTITAVVAGGWAAQVGKTCEITNGARIRSRFVVLKDLGANVAQISEVYEDFLVDTPVVLQAGDQFAIYNLLQLGGTNAYFKGNWSPYVRDLHIGVRAGITHSAVATGGCFFTADLCTFRAFDVDLFAVAELYQCYFVAGLRAYHKSSLLVSGGGSVAEPIGHDATITLEYFTSFGTLRSGTGGVEYVLTAGTWLGIFDIASTAIHISSDSSFVCGVGARVFGKAITAGAVGRISIDAGGRFYCYGLLDPVINGTGTEVAVGDDTTTFDVRLFNTVDGASYQVDPPA